MFTDTNLIYFSSIVFQKNYGFVKKSNPSEKNVIVEKELDCIDIDDIIGNLKYSPRLVFINEGCGNLIVINDGGELTGNISQIKTTDV